MIFFYQRFFKVLVSSYFDIKYPITQNIVDHILRFFLSNNSNCRLEGGAEGQEGGGGTRRFSSCHAAPHADGEDQEGTRPRAPGHRGQDSRGQEAPQQGGGKGELGCKKEVRNFKV